MLPACYCLHACREEVRVAACFTHLFSFVHSFCEDCHLLPAPRLQGFTHRPLATALLGGLSGGCTSYGFRVWGTPII